MMRLGQSHGH